ncbi:MAG: PilZ domain-containing protein [Actinomycetes bacterium]
MTRRAEGLSLAWVAITALFVTGAACTRWVFSRHRRRPAAPPQGLGAASARSQRRPEVDETELYDTELDDAPEKTELDKTELHKPELHKPELDKPERDGLGSGQVEAAAPENPDVGRGARTEVSETAAQARVPVVRVVPEQKATAAVVHSPQVPDDEARRQLTLGAQDTSRRVLVDRRMTPRVPYEAPAVLRWRGRELPVETVDLSESGVRIRLPRLGPQDPPVPLQLEVVTILLSLGDAEVTVTSEVRFRRPSDDGADLGLQFQDLAESDGQRLRQVVESVDELVP